MYNFTLSMPIFHTLTFFTFQARGGTAVTVQMDHSVDAEVCHDHHHYHHDHHHRRYHSDHHHLHPDHHVSPGHHCDHHRDS